MDEILINSIVLEFPVNEPGGETVFDWNGPTGNLADIFSIENAAGLSSISTNDFGITLIGGSLSSTWYYSVSVWFGGLEVLETGQTYIITNYTDTDVLLRYAYETDWTTPVINTPSWAEGSFHPFNWQNYEINYESSTLTFGFSNWTEL